MTGDQITQKHVGRSGEEDADDPRIVAAVQEYMSALDRGELLDRQQFLARHAAIAEPLSKCLDGLELVHRATANLRHESTAEFGLLPDQLPLGDFRVIREIGRGGMGVVYEAIQLSLGRRVALKVLSMAATLDPKHLARFKNEAYAAAQLHHTNIVPVYAVGTERGVHFYAMQLIDGYPLSALIEHLRQSKQTSASGQSTRSTAASLENSTIDQTLPAPSHSGSLSGQAAAIPAAEIQTEVASITALSAGYTNRASYFRNVAKLMRDAAAALEHAHQFGVIHRDIKPANLLLDGHGNLWITDFGLAQFQTDSQLTQTGDMLGTLRYMSPEQASGGRAIVDHRTDVYSLGATFYEFLTLKPVLDSGNRHELLRGIVDDEPQPLRSIDPHIPVELETIVLKSLSKLPAERYATAGDLADDLQRWLSDKPILARRPTLRERAARWRRQHRALVTSAIALLCLLSIVSLATSAIVFREHSKTQEAYQRELAQHAAAEQNFEQAREAVDAFSQLGASEQGQSPAMRRLRRQILETALTYYQDFIDQRRDDRAASAALVAAQQRIARIVDELSVIDGFAPLALLGDPRVSDELALTASQQTAVSQMHAGLKRDVEERRNDTSTSKAESREQLLKDLSTSEEQIQTLLNGDQLARLKQIVLQVRQPFSFSDREVVEQLALSADQQRQINAIIDQHRPSGPGVGFPRDSEGRSADIHDLRPAEPGRGLPRSGGPPPEGPPDGHPPRGPKGDHDGKGPDGFHPKGPPLDPLGLGPGGPGEFGRGPPPRGEQALDGPIDRTVPKILEVLTPEQRAKWREMIGEPLHYHVPPERIEFPVR
jgi:eukaryotic-like serine/threonine-protein kinase